MKKFAKTRLGKSSQAGFVFIYKNFFNKHTKFYTNKKPDGKPGVMCYVPQFFLKLCR